MADPHAPTDTTPPAVEIDAGFMAERQQFWSSFTGATTFAVVAIVVLLIGMLIFLR